MKSSEILVLLSQCSLLLASYGVWVFGHCPSLTRDSGFRTNMVAPIEKPELSPYRPMLKVISHPFQ